MPRNRDPETIPCRLCLRDVPSGLITLHHLLPKEKGGKAEDRTPLCRPCHKQLHAVFSNADLAKHYATIEALQAAPLLQPFLKWIRKQRPDRTFATTMSHSHPRKRRRR